MESVKIVKAWLGTNRGRHSVSKKMINSFLLHLGKEFGKGSTKLFEKSGNKMNINFDTILSVIILLDTSG